MLMKRIILSIILLAVSLAMVADNIAYAALSKDATTLIFSYGTPPTDLLTWEVTLDEALISHIKNTSLLFKENIIILLEPLRIIY